MMSCIDHLIDRGVDIGTTKPVRERAEAQQAKTLTTPFRLALICLEQRISLCGLVQALI